MGYYDLTSSERKKTSLRIHQQLKESFRNSEDELPLKIFNDADTYIRKAAYLATGRIFFEAKSLQSKIIDALIRLYGSEAHHVRQTVVNATGEIAKKDFDIVMMFFDHGLFDKHHTVRNAVIGSIKKSGEVNPEPVLAFAKKYLHHPEKEIRREICHGIELRGRKHPEDILPLLKELQYDNKARVRNTLVHVLGQIAYKKGCLETVIADLNNWENRELVDQAIEEIIDVHYRYRNFSFYNQDEAKAIIINLSK